MRVNTEYVRKLKSIDAVGLFKDYYRILCILEWIVSLILHLGLRDNLSTNLAIYIYIFFVAKE